jgi:hypothetical protein
VDTTDCLEAREHAWLNRGNDPEAELWRPPEVHRSSSKAWIVRTDAQIRACTVYKGWQHFLFEKADIKWANPWKWPQIITPTDLGSDNVCALNALLYLYDANLWPIPDWSHMSKCAWEAGIKAAGLWDLIILALIVSNLEYGPYDDESRRGTLAAATGWHYENRSPRTCPLFREHSVAMLADSRKLNWFHAPPDVDPEDFFVGLVAASSEDACARPTRLALPFRCWARRAR